MTPEELLKEVGEPVGYHYLPNNEMFPVEEVSRSNLKNNPQDYVFLYTSDQVAAAILKVTGSLEKEIERLKTVPMKYRRMAFNAQLQDENNELRAQLAAAQEETESSEAVEFDVEAVAWAYGKCVALGLENGSMESAMMMDRLKMMLGGY